MSDYKEMYFRLFRATEDAMELLIKAQRECEEMYLSAEDEAEEKEKPSPLRGGRCPAETDEGVLTSLMLICHAITSFCLIF